MNKNSYINPIYIIMKIFKIIKHNFFYSTNLTKLQKHEFKNTIIDKNIKSIFFMLVLGFLIQLANALCNPYSYKYNCIMESIDAATYYMTALIIAYIILVTLILKKGIKHFVFKKYTNLSFLVLFSLVMQKNIESEVINHLSIYNYIILLILLSIIPILSFGERILLAVINVTITCFIISLNTNSHGLIQVVIWAGVISVIISQRNYNIFIKCEKSNIELVTLSETDSLTKLLNRRGIRKKIHILWSQCMQDNQNIFTLMIDIDNFKLYNDTFGHVKGDVCLNIISRNIQANINNQSDVVGRYGGEEILVILSNISEESCIALARKIKKNIELLDIESGIGAIHSTVTTSIGIHAVIPNENVTFKQTVNAADQQLYLAKKSGRNCIAFDNIIYR